MSRQAGFYPDMLNWVEQVTNTTQYETNIIPSVCEQASTLYADVPFYIFLAVLGMCQALTQRSLSAHEACSPGLCVYVLIV